MDYVRTHQRAEDTWLRGTPFDWALSLAATFRAGWKSG